MLVKKQHTNIVNLSIQPSKQHAYKHAASYASQYAGFEMYVEHALLYAYYLAPQHAYNYTEAQHAIQHEHKINSAHHACFLYRVHWSRVPQRLWR